jgi:hypothetical protein
MLVNEEREAEMRPDVKCGQAWWAGGDGWWGISFCPHKSHTQKLFSDPEENFYLKKEKTTNWFKMCSNGDLSLKDEDVRDNETYIKDNDSKFGGNWSSWIKH